MNQYRSHGSGEFQSQDFNFLGSNTIFESGVLVFHPENIKIQDNVYIGHNTILKGYYKNLMTIDSNTWIGQGCFFHSAGGLIIGKNVGIGPYVKIITSHHTEAGRDIPILHSPVAMKLVSIADDCDIGVGTIILPGVTIGKGAQIGAGAVITKDIPAYAIAAGIPAKILRYRPE